MRFYHLSRDASLKFIQRSSAPPAPTAIAPKTPDDCPDEEQVTRRVCVAPTVWQCLLSISCRGRITYYIYEIETECVAEPQGPPVNFAVTDEKWVTDDVVDRCGGVIKMNCRGFITATDELEWGLRKLKDRGQLPRHPAKEDSVWHIWDGEWSLAADDAWAEGIAQEWADDLLDPHQDIYNFADGAPPGKT